MIRLLPVVILLFLINSIRVQAQNTDAKPKLFSAMIYLPGANAMPDTFLPGAIIKGIESGAIIAYADSGFMNPFPTGNIRQMAAINLTDTFVFYERETGQELSKVIMRDFDLLQYNVYKILARGMPGGRTFEILGLAVSHFVDNEVGPYDLFHETAFARPPGISSRDFFWMKYKDVKELVGQYNEANSNRFSIAISKIKVPETNIIDYDNGDRYDGHTKNGVPNGRGTFYYAHGTLCLEDYYTGEWVNGIAPTTVTYHFAKGPVYIGGFRQGKFHGRGIKTWLDGDKYSGNWAAGYMSGEGIYTWASGSKHIGHFDSGYFSGKGTRHYDDGDKYTGSWKLDEKWGEGTFIYADGGKYIGHWENGMREGTGTFTWISGEKYTGQFHENERTGEGTYYWPNGDKYTGHFDKGAFSGQGTKYSKNGDKQEGNWKDDEPDGYSTIELADKNNFEINNCPGCVIYKGYWLKGMKHGTGSCYDKNGRLIYDGPFADDKPTGNYPGRGKQ